MQHALVRLSAVRREAAPELVLAGQVDVGVLGQEIAAGIDVAAVIQSP